MSTLFCTTRSKSALCRASVSVFLAFTVLPQSARSQKTDPLDRLQQLSDATSLQAESLKPWHISMSFKLLSIDGEHEDAGTLDAWWPGSGEPAVLVNGPRLHGLLPDLATALAANTGREAYLIHELVAQLTKPVPFLTNPDIQVTERDRTFGKVSLHCLRIEPAPGHADPYGSDAARELPGTVPEFCTQPNEPAVLRIHFDRGSLAVTRNALFTFQGINLAHDEAISYSGRPAISGTVQTIDVVDANAIPSEVKAAQASQTSQPGARIPPHRTGGRGISWPRLARERDVGGVLVLAAVVSKSGTVTNITPIASPSMMLTGAVASAMQTWTYTPSSNSGVPVDAVITVNMNYHLAGR